MHLFLTFELFLFDLYYLHCKQAIHCVVFFHDLFYATVSGRIGCSACLPFYLTRKILSFLCLEIVCLFHPKINTLAKLLINFSRKSNDSTTLLRATDLYSNLCSPTVVLDATTTQRGAFLLVFYFMFKL